MDNTTTIRRLRPKRAASNCPLTLYPPRYIIIERRDPIVGDKKAVEICRFHNFDVERGCLRNSRSCCSMDHEHCYKCGREGHRAFECCTTTTIHHQVISNPNLTSSVLFEINENDGAVVVVESEINNFTHCHSESPSISSSLVPFLASNDRILSLSSPALLVLGGRLRGRTLAACELLSLSHSTRRQKTTWAKLPNLREHRGSAAACSPIGSGLAFVLGGGTADGNSNAVEMLNFRHVVGSSLASRKRRRNRPPRLADDVDDDDSAADQDDACIDNDEDHDHVVPVGGNDRFVWRWQEMEGRLSEPRHAFGAVACVSSPSRTAEATTSTTTTTTMPTSSSQASKSATIYAVGGWSHGAVSCGKVERLRFEYSSSPDGGFVSSESATTTPLVKSTWESCAPLLLPRRLHSVVSSTDGSFIYVMGGFIDDRQTTSSIERYDVHSDKWEEMEERLPFGERGCPLVQAVSDGNDGFLIFPFGSGSSGCGGKIKEDKHTSKKDSRALVLRYTPGTGHASSSSSATPSSFSQIPIPASDDDECRRLRLPVAQWHSFSATVSTTLRKAYLVGGTIDGKWTNRGYELDLQTYEWTELPPMAFARRRLATLVLE